MSTESPAKASSTEAWGTRIGVILAVAGSAVGLGNFLRFPGQAAQNGGGAFMIPYFVSLLVLGIPLCWAEWTMGRYGGLRGFNSSPGIYRRVGGGRVSMYFGVIGLMLPLVVYMYYVLIEAWCLGYAISYLTGDLMLGQDPDAYGEFLGGFIGAEENGALFSGSGKKWLLVLAGVFVFNFVLIYRGVNKGIEAFCKVAMPLMALLAVVVLVRVLTLGEQDGRSIGDGLGYMWNPDYEALKNPQTWLAAAGQVFFSLSVGFGIIINYSSYLKRDDDVVLSGLTSSSMNEFFEVCLGGLITIPAAFLFMGALAPGTLDSGFLLGFTALPNVFAGMWGGQVFGFLWFFMLFIAAITSSVSMLQPVIAFLEEGFGLRRHASAALLGLITALGTGFVAYFSQNTVALDTFDFWVGTFLIYVLAMFQAILYGWVLGIERGAESAHEGAHFRIPLVVQYMLKYVTPVFLIVIFTVFCWQKLPSKAEEIAAIPDLQFSSLTDGALPKAFIDKLEDLDIPAPKSDRIDETNSLFRERSLWLYDEADGNPVYLIRPADDGASVVVARWNPGMVAKVASNTAATLSVGFLVILAIFLLLLVHIAGLRWDRQGRFV